MQNAVKNQNFVQKLETFKEYVNDDAVLDLKETDEWNNTTMYNGIIMEPQDIGNFHYGYIGRSIEIPEIILYAELVTIKYLNMEKIQQ